MFVVRLASLAVTLLLIGVVAARNIKRDFQPPLRSHVELFLAAAPAGFIGTLIVLPDHPQTVWLAAVGAAISGIGYSFSLPRQWRYDQQQKNKRGSS